MRLAFRLDATAALGLGHLKRCLALATALHDSGAQCCFVGRADAMAVADTSAAAGIAWIALPPGDESADAAMTLAALPWRPDVVVVDHYALDSRWHTAVRAACGAKIVVIDDLADRALVADLLIDPNPAPDHATKYRSVLPAGVPICGGPAFALLDARYAAHARSAWHEEPRCITIFMGGTDPANHSAWVLRVLRESVGWRGTVRVASTSANPNRQALQAAVAEGAAELLLDQPDLADFHAGCDLQIGAGGGALWERCCLGVPAVALVCAENQRQSIPYAAAQGAVLGLEAMGQTPAQAAALAGALRTLIDQPAQRLALRECALQLVDGQGAARAAAQVLALMAREAPLELRLATMADAGLLLAWRNDPHTRASSHSSEVVTLQAHRAWLQATLSNPLRTLWLAWRAGQAVGTVRADFDAAAERSTLSWTVAPSQRGSGIGRLMVQQAAWRLPGALHAEVKVGNEASARIARAAGLVPDRQVGDTLHFVRPG